MRLRREITLLDEGEATLYTPYPLSAASINDFEEWMALVVRKLRRAQIHADPISAAVDAQLAEVGDQVKAFGHTLAKGLGE